MPGTTFTYQGAILQSYTVAATGTFQITADGAQGGTVPINGTYRFGGQGAEVGGDFSLTSGEVLRIVVGGQGGYELSSGGGGGGSFVIETFDGSGSVRIPLLIAGGGGGAGYIGAGSAGQSGGAGTSGYGSGGGAGGSGGQGGGGGTYAGGGGGGYSGGIGAGGIYSGGVLIGSQATGGSGYSNSRGSYFGGGGGGGNGGFGGGGAGGIIGFARGSEGFTGYNGGGGGGYSGGGGGSGPLGAYSPVFAGVIGYGGGGGGSLDNGTNQVLYPGENPGDGLVEITPLCYLRGTRILTPTGEVPVQDLRIGDLVLTRFAAIQPIRWIGRQSYDARFVAADRTRLPVCIRAGALGDRLPARDLYVSPGHSMLVGESLVLARSLVNGVTITQDWCAADIHYFQIELDTHDCVIAEGTWSETYADGPGLRAQFHNAAEFAALYPDHAPPDDLIPLCAPRPEHGAGLDAALRTVVSRAGVGLTPGTLRGWIDIVEAPWRIEGWAQDVTYPDLPVLLELLLEDRVIGTALACDYRADLAEAEIGQGRCAFFLTAPVRLEPSMLHAVRLRRAGDGVEIAKTAACLQCIGASQPPTPALPMQGSEKDVYFFASPSPLWGGPGWGRGPVLPPRTEIEPRQFVGAGLEG